MKAKTSENISALTPAVPALQIKIYLQNGLESQTILEQYQDFPIETLRLAKPFLKSKY